MSYTLSWDYKDIIRVQKAMKTLGEKPVLRAANKAAQKGSNVVGKAVRKAAPTGETGQLKRGFKKKKEKSKLRGKAVYQYALDPAKNDIFQKPVKEVGKFGGKRKIAYYPASIEYGYLKSAGSKNYKYVEGKKVFSSVKEEGTHFAKNAAVAAEPAAFSTMQKTLNDELDKEFAKI